MRKWMIGLMCGLMGATMAMGQYVIDFEGESKTSYASSTISLSGMDWDMTEALIGTTGSDWFNGARSARMRGYGTSSMTMLTDLTNGLGTISFNYRRYGSDGQVDWKVEYSTNAGGIWTQIGSDFTAPATDDVQVFSETVNVGGNVRVRIKRATETGTTNKRLNIDDITMTDYGLAVFGVSFDQTDGFTVEEGSSASITATAANGTAPYTYAWTSDLGATYRTTNDAVFTILATAPVGDYSATVVATDAALAEVTNSLSFSVVAPPPQYAITITTPTNGTVTTDPMTEAEAGATVTVNATPDGGYAVDTITVTAADTSNVPMSGTTFTMPAQAVTVTVTFQVFVGSDLYISEVADPSDNFSQGRFVELYNSSGASIDLAAGSWYLVKQVNGGTIYNYALTGTVASASTYVVADSTNFPVAYPTAPAGTPDQFQGQIGGNGDDGYFLYSGGNHTAGTLEDAYGVLNEDGTGMPWEYEDARAVRNTDVTAGNPTWTASEWTITDPANVIDMTPGVHPDSEAALDVTVDQADNFIVAEGTSDIITATAVHGTEPYTYAWTSDLAVTFYTAASNTFTIEATAPVGAYYATVVVTDNDANQATNTVNFMVTAPYAITVTPGVNGTVTTDPATEAIPGTTVTITATPDATYAVGTIEVVDSGTNPVAVAGNTFTMPADEVTVTVTFVSDIATLPIAESYTGTMDWTTLPGWSGVNMSTYSDGSMSFNASGDMLTVHFDGTPGEVTFDVKGNSSVSGTPPMQFDLEESVDGAAWTLVVSLTDTDVSTSYGPLGPYTLLSTSRYVRWNYVNKYVYNVALNNVIISSGGPAGLAVTVDQTDGFQVNEGNSAVITATATNGTAPYTYAWTSDLGESYRTTNDNVFTILATAPTGDYSATVTVTDDTAATANETVTFSVVGLPPSPPITSITVVAGTGFTFEIPSGFDLVRVEGADSTVTGQAFTWTTLVAPTDYEVAGSTITIKFGAEAQRLIRVWLDEAEPLIN